MRIQILNLRLMEKLLSLKKYKITYKMIKEYIEEKYGLKTHTSYIAEVKRDLGLEMINESQS